MKLISIMNKWLIGFMIIFFHHNVHADFWIISENVALQLYQTMKDFHEILTYSKVRYWAHAGTLLGAVRHGGQIPWDDDIDLVIEKENEQNFLDLIPIFNSYGYGVVDEWFGYKIYPMNGMKTHFEYNYPWLDVMVFDHVGEIFTYYESSKNFQTEDQAREALEKREIYAFEEKDLFPLRDYQFGELLIKGPKDYLPYLNSTYLRWDKEVVVFNHSNNAPIDSSACTKFNLCEYVGPCLPSGPLRDRVVTIQPATIEDSQDLVNLINQLGFIASKKIIDDKVNYFSEHPLERAWTLKIFDKIVGLLALDIVDSFYHPDLFAKIDTIVVDKEYRGLGLGKKLIEYAEDYARSIGCARVLLTSGNHRKQAHKFFEKNGYVSNATYFVKNLKDDSHLKLQ